MISMQYRLLNVSHVCAVWTRDVLDASGFLLWAVQLPDAKGSRTW
jgi:hypothetical protein